MAWATAFSAISPASWPWVSLMCLKWSMSMMAAVTDCCLPRVFGSRAWHSDRKWRRLGRPVRKSRVARSCRVPISSSWSMFCETRQKNSSRENGLCRKSLAPLFRKRGTRLPSLVPEMPMIARWSRAWRARRRRVNSWPFMPGISWSTIARRMSGLASSMTRPASPSAASTTRKPYIDNSAAACWRAERESSTIRAAMRRLRSRRCTSHTR